MNKVLGKRIKELRELKGLTQEQLAKLVNLSQQTIGHYEVNRANPDLETLEKFVKIFDCSFDYLFGNSDIKKTKKTTVVIPILGTIRAGLPLLAEDNWIGEVEVPADLKAAFALRVVGASMSWVGVYEGDIAILCQDSYPSHGMIVAAGVEDVIWEATLKFYVEENGKRLLLAANPAYRDIEITDRHRIIGHVVSILKEPPSLQDYKKMLVSKEVSDASWAEAIEIAAGYGLDGDKIKKMMSYMQACLSNFN